MGAEMKNQRGNAMIETLPLLAIFLIFVAFGLGMFGVIHTGILYSIAARTYAFETFRNRTNLTYHRENLDASTSDPRSMRRLGARFHVIQEKSTNQGVITATSRPIAVGRKVTRTTASMEDHNVKVFNIGPRNQNLSFSPVWIMVGYGMCLNAQCGSTDTVP